MSNKEFYYADEEFRDYVNRYIKSRNISLDVALSHLIVTIQRKVIISERRYNGVIK